VTALRKVMGSNADISCGQEVVFKHYDSDMAVAHHKIGTRTCKVCKKSWAGSANTPFSLGIAPVSAHRGRLDIVLADGHAANLSRTEFQNPGRPATPLQNDPK
jgi:hypothetical protein